jgi:WD40 repeat protein
VPGWHAEPWPSCPPPDLPSDALIRVLAGHGWVYAVAIDPDGTWLATADMDRDGADLGRHRGAQLRRYSDTGRR